MKYAILYYKPGLADPIENLDEELVKATANIGGSKRQNVLELEFSNGIVDYFSDGTPRRRFTTPSGSNLFEATRLDDGYLNFEERIELYVSNDLDLNADVIQQDNLLFSGQIHEVEPNVEESKNTIKISCADRTGVLLNRIASQDFQDVTPMEICQLLIRTWTEQQSSQDELYDTNGVLGTGAAHKYPIDARLFTEGIKHTAESVSGVSGRIITCSGATFETDGVEKGDVIKNTTTHSLALVRRVISETELEVSKSIFSVGHSVQCSDGFIQDFRPNGSAFPDISFGFRNKPLVEWFDNMVEPEWTNSRDEVAQGTEVMLRPMKYYLDGRNRLHVFFPDNVPSYKIVVGAEEPVEDDVNTYTVIKHKVRKSVFDIMNYIVFRAGEDMNGNQIRGFAQDPTLGGPIRRDAYRPFLTISSIMKAEDTGTGRLTQVDSNNWDYPASYGAGYTPNWNTNVTVNNDAEYNLEFRVEARKRGVARALDKIRKTANPRWRGTIETEGFNYNQSDLVRFTDRSIGVNRILVRIDNMTHSIGMSGWFTSLNIEEDIPLQRRLNLGG